MAILLFLWGKHEMNVIMSNNSPHFDRVKNVSSEKQTQNLHTMAFLDKHNCIAVNETFQKGKILTEKAVSNVKNIALCLPWSLMGMANQNTVNRILGGGPHRNFPKESGKKILSENSVLLHITTEILPKKSRLILTFILN